MSAALAPARRHLPILRVLAVFKNGVRIPVWDVPSRPSDLVGDGVAGEREASASRSSLEEQLPPGPRASAGFSCEAKTA